MKIFFKALLPLLALLALPAQAQQIGSPVVGQSPAIGGGMSPSAADNSAPLNAAITKLVTQMTTQGTALNIPAIQIPQGIYAFTGGVTSRPWIKLNAVGNIELDFSGAGSTVTAFRVHNQDAVAGAATIKQAANQGPFINGDNGAIFINGPGSATASIGLDVGDQSGTAGGGQFDFRDSSVAKLRIMNFGTCIHTRITNTYFLRFDGGGAAESCTTGVDTESGTNTNSGELDSFDGWLFSGGTNGYVDNAAGIDMEFDNTSFDFYSGAAIVLANGAGFNRTICNNCHFEHDDGGIIQSTVASNSALNVILRNIKYVSHTTVTHGDAPRQAIFQGKMSLDLDGLTLGGYANAWRSADTGMFMADSNVSVVNMKNISFTASGIRQLTSAAQIINDDPLFAQGTLTNDLVSSPMPTWTVTAHSGITAIVDNTNVWTTGGGTKSIKFTQTAGSNFYVILSDKMKVRPGQQLLANTAYYGGTSTGSDSVQLRFYFTNSVNSNMPTLNDGGAFGENMSTAYGDTADPAYTGGTRTWWAKMNSLRLGTVPAGYDQAQLEITVSSMGTSDVVWLGFAGVTPLN